MGNVEKQAQNRALGGKSCTENQALAEVLFSKPYLWRFIVGYLNMAITMSFGAGLGLVIGSVVYGFKKK